jgi:hypothetical protein
MGVAAATLLVALVPGALRGQTGSPPCATPDHRAFDFWVGEWEVFRPDGALAGSNTIRVLMNGCVLHESYDTPTGYHGESFNTFDATRGVWHQTWVDNGGVLLVLEGGPHGDGIRLEGTGRAGDGTPVTDRITWSPLNPTGNRVRQHWERSSDGGTSWTTVFDGEYRRRR